MVGGVVHKKRISNGKDTNILTSHSYFVNYFRKKGSIADAALGSKAASIHYA